MPKIEQMFAFVCEERPGDEGLAAAMLMSGLWFPLVGADMARIESLRELAQNIANGTGLSVQLIRFDRRVDLETLVPVQPGPPAVE